MKKRLFMFILSLGLLCSMSGCNKTYLPDAEVKDSTRNDNDINKDTSDKTEPDEGNSDYETEIVPSDVLADGESIYLVYSDKSIRKVASGKENEYTYT